MARIYSLHAVHRYELTFFPDKPHLAPVTPTFDFEAAFPSIAHDWILLVLRARGVPQSFLYFLRPTTCLHEFSCRKLENAKILRNGVGVYMHQVDGRHRIPRPTAHDAGIAINLP